MGAKKVLMKILGPFILAQSKVVKNERLSPHFQYLTIKGKSHQNKDWIPGQKIQVQLKNEMRSYTPSSWNKETGEIQTLIYMHGKGPGAIWARDARENSKVTVLGPKSPLKLHEDSKHVLFFGDETTYGLAHALKQFSSDKNYRFFFEATDTTEAKPVLERFALGDSPLFAINQLEKVAEAMITAFRSNPETEIVLSGKQQSIVALREKLWANQIPKDVIGTKVYWGWKDDPNGKLKNK